MRRTIVMLARMRIRARLSAQAAPPPTDIFLAPLSMKDGVPVVGTPVNITHQPGYDNQPWFTPDSRSMLFTSARGETQTDIYRFDVASRATTRVTQTPESEYSATGMPGGQRFSVIRVEADMTQRLWSFANDGAIRGSSSKHSSPSDITCGSTRTTSRRSCSEARMRSPTPTCAPENPTRSRATSVGR